MPYRYSLCEMVYYLQLLLLLIIYIPYYNKKNKCIFYNKK